MSDNDAEQNNPDLETHQILNKLRNLADKIETTMTRKWRLEHSSAEARALMDQLTVTVKQINDRVDAEEQRLLLDDYDKG